MEGSEHLVSFRRDNAPKQIREYLEDLTKILVLEQLGSMDLSLQKF